MVTFSYDPGRNIIVTRTSGADTGGARNKTYGPAPNNLLALVQFHLPKCLEAQNMTNSTF